MTTTLELSFAEETTLGEPEEGAVRIQGRFGKLSIHRPSPGLRAALEALRAGGTETALAALAGPDAVRLFYYLGSAAELGLLRWTVVYEGARLATLSPASPYFVRLPGKLEEPLAWRLSRFAYCRGVGEGMVVECPLSHATLSVHDRRVAMLLFELSRSPGARELTRLEGLDSLAVNAIIQLLADAAMLEPLAEEETLRQWEFHDLLFHSRTRGTRHAANHGATHRFEGVIPPLPVVKPPMAVEGIDLARPDLDELSRSDPPFTVVLERRKTLYARGPAALTQRQLGEFLFRTARIRQIRPSPSGELSDRPYPGAGARYELELYPLVRECEGIAPGLYHYCPLRHRLERLSGETAQTRALLEPAIAPEPISAPPDVLLIIAARFQRVSWKYESIAYSLILKDVGVLMQTMYLVATAMGLTPYAIGRGDADLFCQVAGTDYLAETSVGEFALSGPPAR